MTENRQYFPERLLRDNIDCYIQRAGIARAMRLVLPRLYGKLLDVGCGNRPYREYLLSQENGVSEYVGLDFGGGRYEEPDVTWDGQGMPFRDEEFESLLMTEVLEHCPEPLRLLGEAARVMKQGGVILATVPFIWPLHEIPHDECRYTPFALLRLFEGAGFTEVKVSAFGGWDASLAQMMGLWVQRRSMPVWKRRILRQLFLPLMRGLMARDVVPVEFCDDNLMCPGFSVVAVKGVAKQ